MTKEKIQQKINARNALSPEQHARDLENFVFDLQLFGGGGGKDGGKLIGSIFLGALTAVFAPAIGLAASTTFATGFANFMLGASLFSSIWTATHQPEFNTGSLDIKRFDRAAEQMSSQGSIPVVYGRRLLTGNQTFHEPNSDAQVLHKHVVLCEGGIEGIESVTANDMLLPAESNNTENTKEAILMRVYNRQYSDATVTVEDNDVIFEVPSKKFKLTYSGISSDLGTLREHGFEVSLPNGNEAYIKRDSLEDMATVNCYQAEKTISGIIYINEGVVFSLQNVKYDDATVQKIGKTFRCTANGKTHEFYLCNKDDTDGSFWSYQVNISSLVTYLNSLSEGWEAFPVAATNKLPGEMFDVPLSNAYQTPVLFSTDTVTGGTKYSFHDSEPPENYDVTGGYPNMVWLDLTFTTQSSFSGNPNVKCLIKGKKVYDVRTGVTAYSTNPALCLRDFLLSKRYGLGKWFTAEMLDDDSWSDAADYCDEEITFLDGSGAEVRAKRYELNMVIDQKRTGLEWVQEILANFAGFLVYSDGKLKLKIEQPTAISYAFTDSNCSDLKVEPLKLSETPNRYEVTIVDPLNNWSSVKALCEDFADQKLRQRIVTKEVSLEGVTSQNQALRLARFYRDYNLVCPIQVSFTTGMQAMHLEPGDVVTIDFHDVFKGMPIRIAEIKETSKGTFEISGRQYNDTIYGDELGGGIHWYNYSQVGSPLSDTVPDINELSLDEDSYVDANGTYFGTVTATWTPSSYTYLSGYEVYYRINSSGEYSYAGTTPDARYVLRNIPQRAKVDVKVVVVNSAKRRSNGKIKSITTIGKNSPPKDITKFVVGQYGNEMRFVFNGVMPSDPDVSGVEVRIDGDTWDDAMPIFSTANFPYTTELLDIEDGTHTFRAKAYDTVGNYSENDAAFTLTVHNINLLKNIILEQDDIATKSVSFDSSIFEYQDGVLVKKDNIPSSVMGGNTTVMSQVIDTHKIGSTNIRYAFDAGVCFIDPIWNDIWDKTFSDVEGMGFYTLSPDETYDVYVRFSNNGSTWTDWQLYIAASYQFRYIQYKIVFYDISTSKSIAIRSLKQYYDVPDFYMSIRNHTVFGKSSVSFGETLYSVPTEISFIVTNANTAVSPVITPSKTGVEIKTYDYKGKAIDVDYLLTVRGY